MEIKCFKKITSLVLLGCMFIVSGVSHATVEKSVKAKITRFISYANFGEGDVFISLESNGVNCDYGYFVNANSKGYESTVSTLLAAYHSKTLIYIYAYDDRRWSGSTNAVCELYAVEL